MNTPDVNPALQAMQESIDANGGIEFPEEDQQADSVHPQATLENSEVDGVAAPDMLEVIDSPLHKNGQCFNVQLYADGCLDCKSLVQDAQTDFKKCHFTAGNLHCPAQYFKISFIGEKVKWEKRISKIKAMPVGAERTDCMLGLIEKARDIESDDLRTQILGLIGI